MSVNLSSEDLAGEGFASRNFLAALSMMGRRKGVMPFKGLSQIKTFTGHRVAEFLGNFNALAHDFEVTEENKCRGVLDYLSDSEQKNINEYVRNSAAYKRKDWAGIEKLLKETFLEDTHPIRSYTVEDLRILRDKTRTVSNLKQLADYYFEYRLVADALLAEDEITAREHGRFFFKGLPLPVRLELEAKEQVERAVLTPLDEAKTLKEKEMTLEQIYQDCQQLFRSEGTYSYANSKLDSTFQQKTEIKVTSLPMKGRDDDSKRDIESLVKAMEQMRVEFAQFRSSVASQSGNNYTRRPNQNSPNQTPATGSNSVPIVRKCPYDGCDRRKNDCSALQEDLAANKVKMDSMGHLCYPDSQKIPFIAGQMIHLARNWASSTPSPVQTSVIHLDMPITAERDIATEAFSHVAGYDMDDDYFVEEKHGRDDASGESERERQRPRLSVPEVVVDASPRPMARRTGQSVQQPQEARTTGRPALQPVNPSRSTRPTNRAENPNAIPISEEESRQQKEKRAAGHTMWAPVNDRAGGPDAIVDRVIGQILDSSIPMSVSTILGISPQAAKKMSEAVHRRRVPVPTSNPLRTNRAARDMEMDEIENNNTQADFTLLPAEQLPTKGPLYTHALGKIHVKIGGTEVIALVDTGSEINLMPKRTWSRIGCHIREDGNHHMVSANQASTRLVGIAEDLNVTIGSLRVAGHFFVCEEASWDLLIGMPLLSKLRAQLWFENEALWLRLEDDDGRSVRIRSTLPKDLRNRDAVPASRRVPSVATILMAEAGDVTDGILVTFEDEDNFDLSSISDTQPEGDRFEEVDERISGEPQDEIEEDTDQEGNPPKDTTEDTIEEITEDTIEETTEDTIEETTEDTVQDTTENPYDHATPILRVQVNNIEDDYEVNTKYKTVDKKVRPLNIPLPEKYGATRFFKPALSRDPNVTAVRPNAPTFQPGGRLTEERVQALDFGPEGWINEQEKQMLLDVLRMHEKALSWDKSEKGCLKQTYASDYVIPVVDHVPWQDKPIPISKALYGPVMDLLKDEMAAGDLEPSSAPYSMRWFVVQKKNGKIRKVDGAESLNKICVKDSGLPPNVEDFQQAFQGYHSYALLDMMSGYDQRRLAVESRDLTTIRTPLGLLRRTRLPQGYTNAVAEFQRTMTHVFGEEIPEIMEVFIDDIGIKGAKSDQNNETISPDSSIRKWVWEHAVRLERILFRMEEAGLTASGSKMVVIAPQLELVGTILHKMGRSIAPSKLDKIAEWPNPCPSLTSVRGFLGICGYVRPFIQNFANIDYPLRKLLEKKKKFEWDEDATTAVDRLKRAALRVGILHKIDYETDREIILAVDSSYIATGIVLYQRDANGDRQPIRFDSSAFNDRESRYSQPKLELCGVYKALKRMRMHLFGCRFTLEVDARSLIQMLNSPELPNAPMTRWLAYIKLFDFDIKHVMAWEHQIPDALSREEGIDGQEVPFDADEKAEQDLEAWGVEIIQEIYDRPEGALISSIPNRVWVIEGLYEDHPNYHALATYLESGIFSYGASADERKWIRTRASGFLVRNGRLFKRRKNDIEAEVVLDEARQEVILESVHEKAGHRGRDACLSHLRDRFWWPQLFESVVKHIRSCDQCQRRQVRTEAEPSRPTVPSRLFQKVGVDLVHLGEGGGSYKYLIVARDDLSNWVEAKELKNKTAKSIQTFIERDIVGRYGPVMSWITTDNGGEMRKETRSYLDALHIPVVTAAAYHPQANGMVERGHGPLVEACLKLSGDSKGNWHRHLPAALWADRITTRRTTGYSPFELVFGAAPLLPIDVEFETWLFTDWTTDMTTEELIIARVKQIERRDEDMVEAIRKLRDARAASVAYLDKKMAHRLRLPLEPGTLVLQHDTKLSKQWSHRVQDRWFGPFVVVRQHERGSYFVKETNGVERAQPVSAARLRRFFARPQPVNEQDYQAGGEHDFLDSDHRHALRHTGAKAPPPDESGSEEDEDSDEEEEIHVKDPASYFSDASSESSGSEDEVFVVASIPQK